MKKLLIVFFLFAFSVTAVEKIDLNESPLEDLQKLDGIGPVLAERIKEARPFNSLNDLLKVEGIGEATLNNIKNQGVIEIEKEDIIVNKKETDQKISSERQNPFFIFWSAIIVALISSFIIKFLNKKI